MDRFVFTVSELNRYVRSVLESDKNLNSVYIKGEISNFTDHFRSGHLYFSLKDSASNIKCVMFSSAASWLKFRPENGMSVICRGRASVYERDGIYQFYCEDMQPDGAGALAVAFEQLKAKLEGEGLFAAERKKPLPKMPRKIGVITSDSGAALRDILNVTSRRFPLAEILLHPALVQGADAPASLIAALDKMYSTDAEVIIIGRGGGSAEDLSPFNDEALARKIAQSKIPVISAVGHETDFTICDFVSDMRAPTPSAAAELAVPEKEELSDYIENLRQRLATSVNLKLREQKYCLEGLKNRDVLKYPSRFYEMRLQQNDSLKSAMVNAYALNVKDQMGQFAAIISKLDAMNPLNVIRRGYARVTTADNSSALASAVKEGDKLKITVADGYINCTVNNTEVI